MDKIEIQKNYKLAKEFSRKRKKLLKAAPFHFNLLDESRPNESSHSRIIGKLLDNKENNTFPNLVSFLKHIDLDLSPENPKISVEKGRIDIKILDEKYAIIIENKIHYATDQNKQLADYVEIVKKRNYKPEQIYVIYLTRWGIKKPKKISLPDDLRKELGKRYIEVNFRYHILPWLEKMLPECKHRDKDLIYGLEQYIDHLRGLLKLRYKSKHMNQELNKLIKNEISLSDNYKENDVILIKKIDELNTCLSDNPKKENKTEINAFLTHLNSMRVEVRNLLRKEMLHKLFRKLNNHDNGWYCVYRIHDKRNIEHANEDYFGFANKSYKYEDTDLFFSIEIQNWKNFLCGIFCENEAQQEKIREAFQTVNIKLIPGKYGWLNVDTKKYTYENREPAYHVYDDKWNSYYSKDMNGMVDMFYNQIVKVFEGWKKLCKNELITSELS